MSNNFSEIISMIDAFMKMMCIQVSSRFVRYCFYQNLIFLCFLDMFQDVPRRIYDTHTKMLLLTFYHKIQNC